ncbi:nucleotide-binding alpha-beta plait domain-containing protein [Tanacetum coccineum]|uniref:Nucleotide-binding alpha-beta plait domain-containing protein n=1 Tax=Tanacetum coccineum TaxID=301880 RepID=A0ABQ5GBV5_9ASTR
MAIGTGHRSNNYSESKRNDHLDNNCRQEQRNKGIPNKSHPNFREEHKSFSSIFVSNIPWNASVQDLWDICNKWGVVINVYIAAKRSKSGHRFGFVRFINVNDINQLVSNLRTAWMGGFHLFADVAKYGRTYNRPVERSGDGKPSVGSNSQSVSINENVFQSFNSYAKAVLGNKSVDMSGKYGTSNAGAESVGVSDCNKVYKEAGNEAVMSISVDDCIDLDGKEIYSCIWEPLRGEWKDLDAKLAHRVSMSSPIDSICFGGGGSGDDDTDGGGNSEGNLDLLRDKDGKSDGGSEDNDGKSDGGDDNDGISDGNSG